VDSRFLVVLFAGLVELWLVHKLACLVERVVARRGR